MSSVRAHIPELDGLRAVAVTLVMLRHFAAPTELGMRSPAGGIYAFVSPGWIGVDLFFAISGFLITGICLDHRGPGFFRAFYARRALRILPPYMLLVGISAMSAALTNGPLTDVAAYATFTTNVRIAYTGTWPELSHLWSVAVEEQFYILWPMIVVVVLSVSRVRRIALIALPAALAIRALLVVLSPQTQLPTHVPSAYVLMPARMDALAVGAWLAAAIRDPVLRDWLRSRTSWASQIPWPLWLAALSVACIALGTLGDDPYSPGMLTVGLSSIALLSGAVVAILVCSPESHGDLGAALRYPMLRHVGRYSYAMYLFHPSVNRFLRDVPAFRDASALGGVAFLGIGFVLSYAIAALSWRVVESPSLRRRVRFPYQNPRNVPSVREARA